MREIWYDLDMLTDPKISTAVIVKETKEMVTVETKDVHGECARRGRKSNPTGTPTSKHSAKHKRRRLQE